MSNPPNQLSQFRSYSAVHILIMADGMETADMMYDTDFSFERDDKSPENLYAIRNIDDSPENRFVVLYDGRSDTNFFIEEIEWETILAPKHGNGGSIDHVSTIETEGSMTIIEPLGVSFLETLVTSTSNLGVEPNSVVFLLKTIFVGHDDSGQIHEISNVRPFTFKMIDLTAKMNASKAEYSLTFFGMVNGTSKLPQISSIGNSISLVLKKGDTLANSIHKLELAINEQYEHFYQKLLQKTDGSEEFLAAISTFVKVEYGITLADEYTSADYKVGGNIPHDQFIEGGNGTFQLKFSDTASVENCIQGVLNSCEQIEKDASKEQTSNPPIRHLPKIISAISPKEARNRYFVEYNITKFPQLLQSSTEEFKPAPGDFIEFDYIYTGKNIDIIDFDIKMDMGLSFFYTGLTTKATPATQKESESESTEDAEPASGLSPVVGGADETAGTEKVPFKRRSPLYLGASVDNPEIQHRINPVQSATFDQMLQRQARLESVSATITILGNPRLLNDVIPRPRDISSDVLEPIDPVNGTGTQNFLKTPSVAKVNIKYPANKDLTEIKDFWYRGYYTIFAVKNEFKGGRFTQVLDMISIPVADDGASLSTIPPTSTPLPSSGRREFIASNSEFRGTGGEEGNAVLGVDYKVKPGANIENLSDEIKSIIDDIVAVWKDNEAGVIPVITSGNDSRHKVGSLHFKNHAIDVRGNNIDPANNYKLAKAMAAALQTRIGSEYDVLFEIYHDNVLNNHFHIEYDPKRRSRAPEAEEGDVS